jgi:branched-chain amino acid transport system permease protein
MEGSVLIRCIIEGLMMGMLYILVAIGLTLVFSIMDIVNFAHGEFYMLGGFISYVLFGQLHFNYFLTILIALIAVGLFSVLVERLVFKPFRGQILPAFIISLGLIWIFRESIRFIFGNWDKAIPVAFPGIINVGKLTISVERFTTALIGAILIFLLHLFIQRTKWGRAMRAIALDRDAASLQGINIDFISSLAFGIGCGLAAVAGVLLGSVYYASASMGAHMILKAFLIIILGGLGSIPGCLLGGLLLGFFESFGHTFLNIPTVTIITFAVIFILLVFRPQGLLGHE